MITAIQQLGQLETYRESFYAFQKLALGRDLPWLRQLREDAFALFYEVGFPTTHHEDWRFTNLSRLAQTSFRLAGDEEVSFAKGEQYRVAGASCQLVFVNGRFRPELSLLAKLAAGVKAGSLAEHIRADAGTLEQHLGRYLNTRRDPFAALNTAFAEDGAYVEIAKGQVVEEPICLLFLSTGGETPLMSHPRNLIVAAEHSQCSIVEDYVSLSAGPAFSNTVSELVVGDGAVVSHCMVEREHEDAFNISTLSIHQGRSSNVASHSLLLGGGLVRNNVHPVLAGQGAECLINGLFIGHDRQHLDNYMLVEHAQPHCESRQFYNGILDGQAHGVFHGRIVVHKDAQKTDAKQTNRNLLLSDDAQIDTKPQLEIYADDVKCTHGATIGQIEENALFYLRSRGIDEVSARKLLLLAFASECLERMKPGLIRTHVEALVRLHLLEMSNPPAARPQGGDQRRRNWEEIR